MADRRTKIILQLDSGPFKRGLASASAAAQAFTRSLDTSNDRMSWLVQSSLALGPALVPIGATAIPAVAGLTAGLTAAAGAAGVAALAFQGIGDGVSAANKYALEPSAKNLEELRAALANLGPAGQEFVLFLDDLRPKMRELREAAQGGLFPGLMDGIDAIMTRAPELKRIIRTLADTSGDLMRDMGEGLASARWDDFFTYMETEARPILSDFGHAMGNFTEGLANMLMGFDPLTDQFAGGLLQMSRDFADWSRTLDQNDSFQAFVEYVERVGPKAVDTLGTLVVALADIVKAASGIGEYTLPVIELMAKAFGNIAESPIGPALLGAAAAISTLSRAIALMNIAGPSGIVSQFTKVRERTDGVGRAADNLAGKFSKTGALVGGIGVLALAFTDLDDKAGLSHAAMGAMIGSMAGPWGAAIGGGIGLVKDFTTANDALEHAMSSVDRAAGGTNFSSYVAAIKDARREVNDARDDLADVGSSEFWFGNPLDAARSLKNSIVEGVTDGIDQSETEIRQRADRLQLNLQDLFRRVKFPEGGGFSAFNMSLDDLKAFANRAEPALASMGYELKDLEKVKTADEMRRIARGIASYNERADSVPGRTAEVRKAIKQLDNPMISAADSANDLEAALSGLFDPALDEEEAMIAYRRGVIDLRKQLNKTNGTLDQFSKAGLDNREMIADQVKNTMKWAVAQATQDGNSKRAIRTLKSAREMFIRLGTASGMSRKQIEDYLRELNFTKGVWRSRLENNADKAKEKVFDYRTTLESILPWVKTDVSAPGTQPATEGLSRLLDVERKVPDKHDLKTDAPGAPRVAEELGLVDRRERAIADKHDVKVDAPHAKEVIDEFTTLWGWIDKTPDKKDVNTRAPGAKEAAGDIERVDRKMRGMKNRNVTMRVTSKTQGIIDDITGMFDKLNPFNADGRIWDFYGSGGIREQHIAQIAPAGAFRVWAEPETGGEAYIPFAPSKRPRSRAIADETVNRLGGQVLWNRDGAVYATAASSIAPDPSIGVGRIGAMYSEIATEFGKGLGDAMEYALSHISTGFSWPLPRQYKPSGTWGSYSSGGSHPALDWPAPTGTPIYPVFPGRVQHTTSLGSSYGNYTEIDHGGGLSSLYAHQLGFRTRAGATVMPGQTIGLVDSTGNSTGPHLHLELKRNGTSFDYTSMLSGGGMSIIGLPGQYHGDHSGLDRASPALAQSYAHSNMHRWGWSEFHWPYWLDLGNRESGWRWDADNPTSSAYGIPQALPGSKMASAGPDWATNAGTQIDWMGGYIAGRYGSPYKAIQFHNAHNWYGDGGILDSVGGYARGGMLYPGQLSYNELRQPERILDPHQTELFEKLVVTLDAVAKRPSSLRSRPDDRPRRPRNRVGNINMGGGDDGLLGGFTFGDGMPRRRRGGGGAADEIDTPDLTKRAQLQLKRAENELKRSEKVFDYRRKAAKRAEDRVDKAEQRLDDAKGKREKAEAKAALKDAKDNLEVAEKRRDTAEKRRDRAEKDLAQAKEDVKESKRNQRILDRAVRQFNLKGGMGRPEVRAEFKELLASVRETMGKDSPLYKALKRISEAAVDTAKRLDEERKEREKLTERLRSLRQASRQYASAVAGNFRNDPFTGGLDEFGLQLRADTNDARSMNRALKRARRRGLSGGLYKQLAASGNVELAQQFAGLSRRQIAYYERLFERRGQAATGLGKDAAEVVYGKRLDRANRLVDKQNILIERLHHKLDKIEDRVGNRIEAGARRGVRDGMDGKKKRLHQMVLEARS